MTAHIFGIRHHGPGSARSLRRALEALQPDIVLVEGPPDAQDLIPLLTHEQMRPPVALLIYVPDQPHKAVYYPFTQFSPEWQAIHYALHHNIPARFMDLPQWHQLLQEDPEKDLEEDLEEGLEEDSAGEDLGEAVAEETDPDATAKTDGGEGVEQAESMGDIRRDPLRWMARAAGYADGESWWEDMVEQRRDSADLFQGILEMMAALREASVAESLAVDQSAEQGSEPGTEQEEAKRKRNRSLEKKLEKELEQDLKYEEQREAWMRQTLRAAEREGFSRIAVVCGAWHAPALAEMSPASKDVATLRGLPKTKTSATWVPWTDERLTLRSGYGAGIASPAWYQHLWDEGEQPASVIVNWMTRAAALLRAEDLPASPASVIEGVRLAETLACVRERSLPGLTELWEAAQAVFCFGSDLPMRLIADKLVVGERLGQVPDDTPMLPIQQDIRKLQRQLRLPPEAGQRDLDLDLRKPNDLERSRLLHRLNLLDIPWGRLDGGDHGKGTFHEIWRLQWQPEFEVRLIEANVWGTTLMAAATGRTRERATELNALPPLTVLVEQALLADLPEGIAHLMACLENLAAVTSDIPHLMAALPPLTSVLRYGNVRQTDTGMVAHVVDGLIARICVGLPTACASLNDEAAEAIFPLVRNTDQSIGLLQKGDHREAWQSTLAQIAERENVHGLIAGRCCRLLLDQQVWPADEVARRMNLALSTATEPNQAGRWIDGMLRDSGTLLLHDEALWEILDAWVCDLKPDDFTQLLPLLRRTFATFQTAERRQMGERARSTVRQQGTLSIGNKIGNKNRASNDSLPDYDPARAARVLPLVGRLLGI